MPFYRPIGSKMRLYLSAPITQFQQFKNISFCMRANAIPHHVYFFLCSLFVCHMRVFYSSFWCHPFDHNKCNGLKWFSKTKQKTFIYFVKMVKKQMKTTTYMLFSQPDRVNMQRFDIGWQNILFDYMYRVQCTCPLIVWMKRRERGWGRSRGASKNFMIKMFYLENFRFQIKIKLISKALNKKMNLYPVQKEEKQCPE